MEVNSSSSETLSPEDLAYLEQLQLLVDNVLEDGKFLTAEVDRFKSPIWSNN